MDVENKIIQHLKSKYNPVSVILYGSRATGKATTRSDWDFVILVRDSVDGGSEEVEGQAIDADIIRLPIEGSELIKQFGGALQTAKVVFDTNGAGQKLLSSTREVYKKGRNLTDREHSNRVNFITRRLKKMEYNVENPGTFFYHLGVFFEKAIQYWFEVKHNRWSQSPGTALRTIEQEDKDYFSLLEVLFSNKSTNEKLEAARKINLQITNK